MSGNWREVDPDVLRRLDEVGQALTDLGGLLAREEEIGRVLQRSVNQVIGAVSGADMASVSVLRGDAAETVASTSGLVWAIDSEQYAAGEGPCLEAARTDAAEARKEQISKDLWRCSTKSMKTSDYAGNLA